MGFLVGAIIGAGVVLLALYVAIVRPTPPWRRAERNDFGWDGAESGTDDFGRDDPGGD